MKVARQTIQAHRRSIEALGRITTLVLSEQPLRASLQAVVQEVSATTGFSAVAIDIYDPAFQQLERVAETGAAPVHGRGGQPTALDQTRAGRVIRSGQAIVEAQQRPTYAGSLPWHPDTPAVICLPLAANERSIGALTLAGPALALPELDLIRMIQSMARVIAALVAHRQDGQRGAVDGDTRMRRQAERLIAAQRDLARLIASATAPEDALPRCLELAIQVTGMDSGGIYLFNADEQMLDLVYHQGLSAAFTQATARYPRDSRNTQFMLSGKSTYLTSADIERIAVFRHETLTCGAMIPIRYQDKVLGCVNLGSHRLPEVPAFARQDLETISVEIGNVIIALRTAAALRELNADLERRVAERTAALQASQERLTLATRSAGIGIWDTNIVANTLTWDDRMYELYGITPETYSSTYEAWLNSLHPDDRTEAQLAAQRARCGEQEYDTEFRVCHPDGTVRVLKANAFIQRDPEGTPLRIIGVNFDITEHRRAEERLRLSEARLQLLLDKTPAVIFSALAEPDYRTTFISESIRTVLGYEPAQFMQGIGFFASHIHPEDQALVFGDAEGLWKHGWRQYEYRCRHADGSYRWVENGVSLLPGVAGQPAEVIGYLIDITARKQTEELLRQANSDLARAARMKDEFLATMSHELRSPLTAILGFSEGLREAIYGALSERQQDVIGSIEASSQHLLALINDILDLSKVEAGKMSLEVEAIGVADVCQASLLFVKELAIKKNIQLGFELSDMKAMMPADPRRLKQILVNLLSNAVKFTPAGGQVSLEVVADDRAEVIRFSVRDTGIGIAPDDLKQLFRPFVQLDSSLSRQHTGTGLGLAIVRRLAEMHGGQITVESAPGRGSSFTLEIPQHPPVAQAEQGAALAPAQAAARAPLPRRPLGQTHMPRATYTRILLAEDNDANILAIEEYLTVKGFAVRVARTGKEALATAIEYQPDLILMDIQMPEVDGLAVMRRLRALPQFAATPIIALTALAMPGDRERCLEVGATAYLSKPVRLQVLVETIWRLLQA